MVAKLPQSLNNLSQPEKAKLVSLYDFYVQVAIAVLLLFCREVTDMVADLLLLCFIFTTYIPAPVWGFGVTLSVLGFALAKERPQFVSAAYLLAMVAVLLYQVPGAIGCWERESGT
jgi:hypothetical protein